MKSLASLLVIFTLGLGSGAALALGKCGEADRVPLPGCVDVNVDGHWHEVTNNCPETVTVVFDIRSGSIFGALDKRYTIEPGMSRSFRISDTKWVESYGCCPRYNNCEF